MKTMRFISTCLLFVLMSHATTSLAEDIDIYSGISGLTGTPNVMVIIDNAANSNAQMSACTYWDNAVPTADHQGTKSLDNYMCALDSIAHGMATNYDGSALVNLGLTTQAGVYLRLTPVDDNPYTGTFAHTAGQTNRQVISKAIRAITDLPGNATQGTSFQETWAYYTGGNGGATNVGIKSGTVYTGTIAATGCQKNYAIFISGVTSSAHANTDGSEFSALTAAVNNAVTAGKITSVQGTALTTRITSSTESPWAVEWSRFMNSVDVNSTSSGAHNIITYSVAAGSPVYPATMGSMEKYIYSTALYGGGKYYAATSYSAIYQSILKILNEVQAVNSVFSSSSLPVSVNAQGTYLNQVYMGMFRPDASGSPRWVGNLKQYQFIFDAATDSLKLGDSLGLSAISSAGTGFISPNAVSYWTCGGASTDPNQRACSPVADPTNGFWLNDSSKTNSAGKAFDLPDGELVEKGGAAQIMRLANLNDDYTTTAGSSTNPRKLYTYCPSGSGCNAALTDSSNAFAKANVNIAASQFGGASYIPVSSVVRTGTTALVTTSGAHGFSTGNSVSINGATQIEYNVTQNITVNSPTTFTITGLGDYPTSPNAGTYMAALHNSSAQAISSVALTNSTTANANGCASGTVPNINCNRITVTLLSHGYSTGDLINIAGVMTNPLLSPNPYSGSFKITKIDNDTFTYNVPVTPISPSVNAYSVQASPPAAKSITNIAKSSGNFVVTATGHGYTNGDSVTISGNTVSAYNGTWTVASATTNTFQISASGNPGTGTGGSVKLNPPVFSIAAGNISRTSATATTATVTGITASKFSNGQTVLLTYVSGSGTSETEYAPLSGNKSVVITCSGTCTSFTFPISTNTGTSTTLTTSSPTAALSGSPVTIPAGAITRTSMGTTATVTGVANAFTSGQLIDISVAGAPVGTESAYPSPAAGWPITCPVAGCSSSFTFGPVTLSPATPATGARITAYQGSTPPAKDPLVDWVRGADNFGDEASLCPPGIAAGTANCPSPAVTVRPSAHGDVLHSRPVVINYSGTTGVVVFYGANDGVFRAINGNQTNPAGSTLPVPGSELWGFVPTEFFSKLDRQRTNSPMLLLSTTPNGILPTPLKKDYFVDGSTGVYQLLNADGTTHTAYIYMAMRRGGRLIYALDVSMPTDPQLLWKIDSTGLTTPSGFTAIPDFSELGQTWSAPKVARVEGYANPVLIFGAGYDTAEDSEPPATDTMGRGIFIVDAITGQLVWSASPGGATACSTGTTPPCHRTVPGMDYSIPADITLVDRDSNGKIDRLYAVDVGGNVWRVDLQPVTAVAPATTASANTPDKWQVTKLAALGCATGVCTNPPTSVSNTPRKFFYPADVVPTNSYDAVMVGQGDREHPLSTDASATIRNRLYMLRDIHTGNDGSGSTAIVRNKLFNATTETVFTAGTFTVGVSYRILSIGTTNFTSIGAASNTVGLVFTATGAGSGTGTATTGTPTTAGAFLTGVSYTILTTGSTDFTLIGAASNTAGSVFTATGPGSGTGTAMRNNNYSIFLPSDDNTTPNMGYYVRLVNSGEKAVNAPLTVAGYTYFGTNQPTAADPNTCSTNLGIARSYRLSPLDATYGYTTFSGGGMPPSPVAGMVSITINGVARLVPFIIGGGGHPTCTTADCSSALGGGKPPINVPTSRTRTYWYQETD